MTMAGLGDRYLGDDYVPGPVRARCRPDVDRLTVQLLQGQHPDEFAKAADTLAHTFGMLACRSRVAGPGVVVLEFARTDRLAELVPALDPADAPRPGGPADRCPRGRPAMTAKAIAAHILIAGHDRGRARARCSGR